MFSLTRLATAAASKAPQSGRAIRAVSSTSPSSMAAAISSGPSAKVKHRNIEHAPVTAKVTPPPSSHTPIAQQSIHTTDSNERVPASSLYADYDTLQVSVPTARVLHIRLNRPERSNAMNRALLHELAAVFRVIHEDRHCRAVVLSGSGPNFCSGVDHTDIRAIMHEITSVGASNDRTLARDVARRAKFLRNLLAKYQDTFNQVEQCAKPVIAVVHGACLGAGLNLIACADIRISSDDAYFQLNDVSAGMMADMGALQRMPKKIASDSWMREMALTARSAGAHEALQHGLVSHVAGDPEQAIAHALALAANIATKSPVAVQGTKQCLNYSRDHTVSDGLTWALNWNMGMLQSDDLLKSMEAIERRHDDAPKEFDDMRNKFLIGVIIEHQIVSHRFQSIVRTLDSSNQTSHSTRKMYLVQLNKYKNVTTLLLFVLIVSELLIADHQIEALKKLKKKKLIAKAVMAGTAAFALRPRAPQTVRPTYRPSTGLYRQANICYCDYTPTSMYSPSYMSPAGVAQSPVSMAMMSPAGLGVKSTIPLSASMSPGVAIATMPVMSAMMMTNRDQSISSNAINV
ncbi:Delta(3,5)-Delta(2,4)-dienoyl-CoA isomerase, mitochondrial [Fragariocoptes setiger]|uniref:Delta(3,5)-Delta(2,4)-dienoyl-CoA isomerase, mitochondrial n=1 Tax=Fragariocoptes setiger TaxID=1670756 RepID=A0ABQ7SCK3_9ACAR|nr:Delta(3,5)-Delta(2,4)-dienoyl-CoA isomerase, mitochondrial [Fragariocoptes setiger]